MILLKQSDKLEKRTCLVYKHSREKRTERQIAMEEGLNRSRRREVRKDTLGKADKGARRA